MATKRTTKKETKNETIELGEGYSLVNFRKNDYGFFNLSYSGAVIYGCRLVEAEDGHLFVSYPSRKGTDDKYYCHARFTEKIPRSVIEAIDDATCTE